MHPEFCHAINATNVATVVSSSDEVTVSLARDEATDSGIPACRVVDELARKHGFKPHGSPAYVRCLRAPGIQLNEKFLFRWTSNPMGPIEDKHDFWLLVSYKR